MSVYGLADGKLTCSYLGPVSLATCQNTICAPATPEECLWTSWMNETLGATKLNKEFVVPATKKMLLSPHCLQFSDGPLLTKTSVASTLKDTWIWWKWTCEIFAAREHNKPELGHLKRVVHIQLKVNTVKF